MKNVNDLIGDAARQLVHGEHVGQRNAAESFAAKRSPIRYAPALSVVNAVWRPRGYYNVFCVHNKPLWEVCRQKTCQRTSERAAEHAVRLFGHAKVAP